MIDGQQSGNYAYDSTGNLTRDMQAGIDQIEWTVYGKISRVTKTGGQVIEYAYDASGNRVMKKVGNTETWYVRDAQGNVLSTYSTEAPSPDVLNWPGFGQQSIYLYGSSRLGELNAWKARNGSYEYDRTTGEFVRNWKRYELTNHLSNVLATISDRKAGVDEDGDGTVDWYKAVVVSATDYYSFGMQMPGRNTGGYRYGFNGKEKDNEMKGDGNSLDFGARVYDPRTGRWGSADPKEGKYISWSPCHFGFNNPVTTIDPDGQENIVVVGSQHDNSAANKLMFVHQGLRQLREYAKNEKGESRTLVIFDQGYTPRQLKRIEQEATKLGATVIKVTSTQHLVNYINSKHVEQSKRSSAREEDKVTNVDAFSHGVVGAIEFGYHINRGEKTNANMTFDKTTPSKIDKQAFADDAVFASYACRTGLGNENVSRFKLPWEDNLPKESLAQQIANKLDITVKAYQVRSDYSNTLSTPEERRNLALYEKTHMGNKRAETITWYNGWQERLKQREMIDGAAFDPPGAIHPVEGGSTPVGVDSDQKTYKPIRR